MTKSISTVGVFAVLFVGFMLALTSISSAASVTNIEFSNGDVTVQGTAGQSVSGKVRIVVPANEEVENVQFDILSDNLSPVCVAVNRLQEGTHFVNISDVKFPPNTGTYTLEVKTSGIFGGMAAIDCNNNVTATQTFSNSVRTVGSGSTVGTGSNTMDSLLAMIAALKAQIEELTKPKPADKPACPPVGSTTTVQAWLLANGYHAGFHAAGVYSPTSHWGPITTSAHAAAMAACK